MKMYFNHALNVSDGDGLEFALLATWLESILIQSNLS